MPDAATIKARIEAAIPGASAEVEDWTGGGDHFRAVVVADAFAGLSRIQQHRLVYDIFGDGDRRSDPCPVPDDAQQLRSP